MSNGSKNYRSMVSPIVVIVLVIIGGLLFRVSKQLSETELELDQVQGVFNETVRDMNGKTTSMASDIKALEAEIKKRDKLLESVLPIKERQEKLVEELKGMGFEGKLDDIIEDLVHHPDLIPFEGVHGGTMGFTKESYVLNEEWVLADFEDGHINGKLLLKYKLDYGEIDNWHVVFGWLEGLEGKEYFAMDHNMVDKVIKIGELEYFPAYGPDADVMEVEVNFYVGISTEASLKSKLETLADPLSRFRFGYQPIEIVDIKEQQGKKVAVINLKEKPSYGKENYYGRSWAGNYFQGSTGASMTWATLKRTFLQRKYDGNWIDGIQVLYEGEALSEGLFEHLGQIGDVTWR